MKFKMKFNRTIFLKKSTWFILALFIITMVYIPRLRTNAIGIEDYVYKVLEIAPGDQYDLNSTDGVTWTSSTGAKIQVTHMNMSQYNSMVDDVAGLYDAVVISDNVGGNNMPTVSTDPNADSNKYPFWISEMYRQYTSPYVQGTTVAKYLYSAGSGLDNDPTKYNYTGKTINGRQIVEYYPQNDITQKRAKNIVNMINKGQSVYIDNKITNNANAIYPALDLNNSNLYKTFHNLSDSNLYKVSSSDINLEKIANDLANKNRDNKRPIVTQVTGPKNETRDSATGKVTPNREFEFSVDASAGKNPNSGANPDETLTINLYLDTNADGIFTDNEKVQIQPENQDGTLGAPTYNLQVNSTTEVNTYKFKYQMYNSFIGFLNWKVDVVRANGVKSSTIGHVTMKNLSDTKKVIKVLQINPNSSTGKYFDGNTSGPGGTTKSSTTQLSSITNFAKKPDSTTTTFKQLLSTLDDYDIQLTDISAADFQNKYGANKSSHLINDYDMVIIGFADNYTGYDSSLNNANYADITDNDALADLDNFIKANKSVMFTHDTMSLSTYPSSGIQGTTNLTKHYRDIIGQSVYPDPTRVDSNNNIIETDLDGNKIPHESLPIPNGQVSLGETPLAINKDQKSGYLQGTRLWESTLTTKIRSINNAQISSYPFDLTKIPGNTAGQVNVSLTHTQWYQLNLEDPDVVPWYNLTSDGTTYRNGTVVGKMDSGDSRDFYYTYSKKNITYSGTGHSGVGNSIQEWELFVNTIIKAQLGSNSAPIVTNMKDDGSTIIPNNDNSITIERTSDNFNFKTKLEDPNADKVKVNITADGNTGVIIKNASTGAIVNQGDYVDNNTSLEVTVPKSIYQNKNSSQPFTISVTGTDPDNATDNKKFSVNLVAPKPAETSHGVRINENGFSDSDISSDGSEYNKFIQGSQYSTITPSTIVPSATWYSKNFAGIISNLYNETYTASLTLDDNLNLTSKVYLYKISNGELLQPPTEMTLNNGVYTADFTPTLDTDSEKANGASYFVTYTADLKSIPTDGKTFKNNLSVVLKADPNKNGEKECNTLFEKITVDNDLF